MCDVCGRSILFREKSTHLQYHHGGAEAKGNAVAQGKSAPDQPAKPPLMVPSASFHFRA